MPGGDVFALLPRQRAVVDHKVHGDGGLRDLLEGDGLRVLRRADGIPDVDVRDAGDGHDGADSRLLHLHAVQTVELIQFSDLDLFELVRVVVVHQHALLVHPNGAVVHLADSDAAHVLVVVDGADEHLGGGVGIPLRGRDVVEDGLKEGRHIRLRIVQLLLGKATLGGRVQEGAVQLLIGGVQIHKELQNLVYHLLGAGLRAVDLVQADDHRQIQVQGLAQHKLRLGHGALVGVHHQDDAVDHLQHALHLAAEIRVSWGVHDVDLGPLVLHSRVLRENGNSPLPLNIVGVHHPLHHFLVGAEHTALAQQAVHQGGLAVVYVGDDGNISHVFSLHLHTLLPLHPRLFISLHRAGKVTLPLFCAAPQPSPGVSHKKLRTLFSVLSLSFSLPVL